MTASPSQDTSTTQPCNIEVPGLQFGCDYNPEQWDPQVWKEDVALMRQAGVNLVAINIFGWSSIEPKEGEYDFKNLDAVMDLLGENQIGVNLGTGTASPPPWLSAGYPQILPMVSDGTLRYPGGRQAWCSSSPVFRDRAMLLVEKVAQRYGKHPALKLWHVSNELGCHNPRCYCSVSAASFRNWLQERYQTVDELNRAWGTSFWSQRFSAWDQVDVPKLTLSTPNPSQVLDYKRFCSQELLNYYQSERDIIRQHSTAPVTTNFMVTAHRNEMNYWQWAPEMDLVANDHYLDYRLENPQLESSFAADVTRGLAQGNPWLLMEHATSAVNWQPINFARNPGQMKLDSLMQVARGADGICFFQWRASLQGAERFHSAMLPHQGTDSRRWREVTELGHRMQQLAEVKGSRVAADVALVFSWESWWALEGEGLPSTEIQYLPQVHQVYQALREHGLSVEVVQPGQSLAGYKFVVVPALYLVDEADAQAITSAAAAGASVLVTMMSGIADSNDRIIPGGYPGAFRDLLGVASEEFVPHLPTHYVGLSNGWNGRLLTEDLHLRGAQEIASVAAGPWAGTPVVTRNVYEAGTAWYVATELAAPDLKQLVTTIAEEAGVEGQFGADLEFEVTSRIAADNAAEYLFFINHGEQPRNVEISGEELLTGTVYGQEKNGEGSAENMVVPANEVRVVKRVVIQGV